MYIDTLVLPTLINIYLNTLACIPYGYFIASICVLPLLGDSIIMIIIAIVSLFGFTQKSPRRGRLNWCERNGLWVFTRTYIKVNVHWCMVGYFCVHKGLNRRQQKDCEEDLEFSEHSVANIYLHL